jgi:hypothetical protein
MEVQPDEPYGRDRANELGWNKDAGYRNPVSDGKVHEVDGDVLIPQMKPVASFP